MMEFILLSSQIGNNSEETDFADECDIDHCATERILRNQFFDPLVSSDSEDDDKPNKINWDQIFNTKQPQNSKLFVPCVRAPPSYPKKSEMTPHQHMQILKIICDEYPNVLEDLFIGKPTRQDFKVFESLQETYLKEQKEYKEWAKSLWVTDHCIRALRPKPSVERVYEAEFKMKAQRMRALPKHYDVAAHITLESQRNNCDAVLKRDLIRVTLADMPQVQIPDKIEKQFSIVKPCALPEPCQKHPYQIVLPNEEALSLLPITEIHRELAIFALNNDSQYIASENALKCLTQWNRHWLLPLSVCDTIGPDGNRVNVMVLGSEFSVHKEAAPMRTYKAFRHLLEQALIPSSERERIWEIRKSRAKKKQVFSLAPPKLNVSAKPVVQDVDMSSDDDDNHLFIDTGEEVEMAEPKFSGFGSPKTSFGSPKASFGSPKASLGSPNASFGSPNASFGSPQAKQSIRGKTEGNPRRSGRLSGQETTGRLTRAASRRISEECPLEPDIGVYSCTCKDTIYEKPPRRSFKKWQFRREGTNERHDIIIHSPHKAKDKTGELLLDPIPEYQLDLGASEQAPDAVRSAALGLALRRHAGLLNVRVDGPTGDVVTFEKLSSEAFVKRHPDVTRQVISTVHTALSQLQELRPGHYVLQHEPSHGPNAMLLCPRWPQEQHSFVLNFDSDQLIEVDEAHMAKIPPTISTALLPYNKLRRCLPCAFSPYENQVAKEPKKPPPKKKAPPQAIKFPKRRRKKNKW